MTEETGRKTGIDFSGIKTAVAYRAGVWSEINGLKSEMDRKVSEICLLEQDVESLKKTAGELAYSAWKSEVTDREELTGIFKRIEQKEEEITEIRSAVSELEQQIRAVRARIKDRKKSPEKNPQAQNNALAGTDGMITCICPVCNAGYKRTVNFCRRCGARLRAELELNGETNPDNVTIPDGDEQDEINRRMSNDNGNMPSDPS